MILTVILVALAQALLAGAGFALMWRRQSRLERDIAELRAALEARVVPAKLRAANMGRVLAFAEHQPPMPALAPAQTATPRNPLHWLEKFRAWRPQAAWRSGLAQMRPDAFAGGGLALVATAPALGFAFGVGPALIVAIGLGVGAFLMLLAARIDSPAAGWAALVTACGWAGAGLMQDAAHAAPVLYTGFAAFAGLAGLAYALARALLPGAALAAAMALALLALGSQIGMAGAAGIGFGALVSGAALAGAHALKLDTLHIGAFAAGLLGLYVLSGQPSAAIWFTPAAAWFGAIFLAISALRSPEIGARGAHIAGLGALAPLIAIAALHNAQHGLPEPRAAAAAFAGAGLALAGVIALAATRRGRGLQGLGLSLWLLAGAAFVAAAAAISLAAPAPLAASGFALLALGLASLNQRLPAAAWRALACVSILLAALFAFASAAALLREALAWQPFALIAAGLTAPALLAALAARQAQRAKAPFTAGLFEAFAIAAAVAAANLALRTASAEGALLLQPVSFVEASAHIGIWLAASLLLASRAHVGARALRTALAYAIGAAALAASALAALAWLTPYWTTRAPAEGLLSHQPLGFAILALLFGAHWVLWRARGEDAPTRLAFGAGVTMSACLATLMMIGWRGGPDGVAALVAALSFAAAIVINFAPGVSAERDAEAQLPQQA